MARSTRAGKNHFIAEKENQSGAVCSRILFLGNKVLVLRAT